MYGIALTCLDDVMSHVLGRVRNGFVGQLVANLYYDDGKSMEELLLNGNRTAPNSDTKRDTSA